MRMVLVDVVYILLLLSHPFYGHSIRPMAPIHLESDHISFPLLFGYQVDVVKDIQYENTRLSRNLLVSFFFLLVLLYEIVYVFILFC